MLFVRSIFLRWLLAVTLPAFACSAVYWSAVWTGGDESEYSAWSGLIISVWYLPSYLLAVTFVYKTRDRVGLVKPVIALDAPKTILISNERGLLGFLVAPIAAIGLSLIAYPIDGWAGAALGTGLFAYIFAIWLGIPSYLLFWRMGWVKFWSITSASTLLGFITALWFMPLTSFAFSASEWHNTLKISALVCLQGAAVGAAYWLIAIAPYKGAASPATSSQ